MKPNRNDLRCVAQHFARWTLAALLASGASVVVAKDLMVAQIASHTHPASAENAKAVALGFNAFFDRVNAAGGVQGNKVVLKVHDDRFDPTETVKALKEAAGDPATLAIFGVIGTPNVGAIASSRLLVEKGLALIDPGTGIPQVQSSPNMFPVRASFFDELTRIAAHSANTGLRKPAFLQLDNGFSPALTQSLEASLASTNRKLVADARLGVVREATEQARRTREAVEAALAPNPDMLVVLAPGSLAAEVVKAVRAQRGFGIYIYMLSIVSAEELVRNVGASNTLGVAISQALPFPANNNLAIVRSYSADLKQHAPQATPSYASLEGYLGARILYEALRQLGPNPTRQGLLTKLNGLGKFDLGDVGVSYLPAAKTGSRYVDITMISRGGKLIQ